MRLGAMPSGEEHWAPWLTNLLIKRCPTGGKSPPRLYREDIEPQGLDYPSPKDVPMLNEVGLSVTPTIAGAFTGSI